MVLGNGAVVGEDRAEVLSGKAEWGSSSLESAEKKESNEISGQREHADHSFNTNENSELSTNTDLSVFSSVCPQRTRSASGRASLMWVCWVKW